MGNQLFSPQPAGGLRSPGDTGSANACITFSAWSQCDIFPQPDVDGNIHRNRSTPANPNCHAHACSNENLYTHSDCLCNAGYANRPGVDAGQLQVWSREGLPLFARTL